MGFFNSRQQLWMVIPLLLCILSCTEKNDRCRQVTVAEGKLLTFTPVKNQGANETCWAYAMLATIEANRLMMGDSVHLSVGYAVRHLLEDHYRRYVLSGGKSTFTTQATAQTLLNIIGRHGIVPHSAYHDYEDANTTSLANKLKRIAKTAINTKSGTDVHVGTMKRVINEALGAEPLCVMMLGAEYTPQEFARSVCAPNEYVALTSFSHHPFYSSFVLEVPDNWEQNKFYNLPIDSLMKRINKALLRGEAVCWEGDISEDGFDWQGGTACLTKEQSADLSQEARQVQFEKYQTTDDHAMSLIGITTDKDGNRLYIAKNSWGTDNKYGGLIYITEDYIRMKTIAVWVRDEG